MKNKRFWMVFLRLCIVLVLFILPFKKVIPQNAYNHQLVEGFWEGEFMPGNEFLLMLSFQTQNGKLSGRILLFQGEKQIQDDELTRIRVDKDRLSFFIEAKQTVFDGKIEAEKGQISGDFKFPDGSVQSLLVKSVEYPSKGDLAEKPEPKSYHSTLHRKYASDQLKVDFNYLRNQLEATHPQLYFFSSKQDFDSLFDATMNQIHSEMTEDQFLRLIAPVLARVRCSHTGVRFSNAFLEALNHTPAFLPLDIHFFENKAYIINDYSQGVPIGVGVRVLSVNGKSMLSLQKQLFSCISSDGFNQTSKLYEMNTSFPYVYSQYIGIYDQFEVECLDSEGKKFVVTLPAITGSLLEEAQRQTYPGRFPSDTLPLRLVIDDESGVAILSVKGFWAPDWNQYSSFLSTSFDKIQREDIRHLIIDVRGNRGGNPFFAAELISYLTSSDFRYFELPRDKGEFAALYQPLSPKEEAFAGDVYVLVNGGCLSTTGHFLSLVKYNRIGVLVGEEPGSSFYSNDRSLRLALPETKIQFNLPQTTYQTAVRGYEYGDRLMPDYFVVPTLEDVLCGKDVQMEYAFKLMQKKNGNNWKKEEY